MRNDFTPQVETREIADADLDTISGGVLGPVVADTVGTVDSVLPTVAGVTGLATEVTGVNTAPVTGLAGL
ncbi:type A2 lantipeptide [Streptomyces sp. NPDC002055]|uniref:type A2 lantipeptide n=1 Tax=Streptomyces sp. NPDC002055 TaxID=3154534 RepID=UPI00332923D3